MMVLKMDKIFSKKCEAGKLTAELKAAGFDIFGVSTAGDTTIVHLKDTETKDPTTLINNHTYTASIVIKPISIEKIIDFLISKGVIASRSDVEA